jgi:hypothetical protein
MFLVPRSVATRRWLGGGAPFPMAHTLRSFSLPGSRSVSPRFVPSRCWLPLPRAFRARCRAFPVRFPGAPNLRALIHQRIRCCCLGVAAATSLVASLGLDPLKMRVARSHWPQAPKSRWLPRAPKSRWCRCLGGDPRRGDRLRRARAVPFEGVPCSVERLRYPEGCRRCSVERRWYPVERLWCPEGRRGCSVEQPMPPNPWAWRTCPPRRVGCRAREGSSAPSFRGGVVWGEPG